MALSVSVEKGGAKSIAATDTKTVYTGHILALKAQSIRLVRLIAGEDDEPIRCNLYTIDLDHVARFEALSYVWGDHSAKQSIFVNEIPFQVGRKLFDALFSLRKTDCDRILWIDALSINQQDTFERNHQVQKMGKICGLAQRVLVWLGPETEASCEAFAFLSETYSGSPNNRRRLMKDHGWIAMKDLYQREYWQRVWIVQEVCLAREAVVLCGRTQISWSYI